MRIKKVEKCGFLCPYYSNTFTEYSFMSTMDDMICTNYQDEFGTDRRIGNYEGDFPEFCKLEIMGDDTKREE